MRRALCARLCVVEALISRVTQFLRPLTVGILSERRALAPFGLAGGSDGSRGVNLWLQAPRDAHLLVCDPVQRTVSLGGKATVLMLSGDRLRLLTPGGGGFGDEREKGGQGRAATAQQLRDGGSLDAYKEAHEGV